MSIIEPLLNALIVGLSASIGAYVGGRLMYRHIKNDVKPTLEHYLNSEQGRTAIYQVGILLGNAIMTGSGIPKMTKSQGGLGGLVSQGLGIMLQRFFRGGAQQQQQTDEQGAVNPYAQT